jgi:hypothetical protein
MGKSYKANVRVVPMEKWKKSGDIEKKKLRPNRTYSSFD